MQCYEMQAMLLYLKINLDDAAHDFESLWTVLEDSGVTNFKQLQELDLESFSMGDSEKLHDLDKAA